MRLLYRKDILVIVDQHLQEGKGETVKTAELLKAAGCVLVKTSFVLGITEFILGL